VDLNMVKDILGKAIGAALQQLGQPPPVVAVVFVPFVLEQGEHMQFGPACVASGKDAPCAELMALAASSLLEADPKPVKVTRVTETGGGS
jgi:hypothetical protein